MSEMSLASLSLKGCRCLRKGIFGVFVFEKSVFDIFVFELMSLICLWSVSVFEHSISVFGVSLSLRIISLSLMDSVSCHFNLVFHSNY